MLILAPLAAVLGLCAQVAPTAPETATQSPERVLADLESRFDEQRKALQHAELLSRYKLLHSQVTDTPLGNRIAQRVAALALEKTLLEKGGPLATLRGKPISELADKLAGLELDAEEELALAEFCLVADARDSCSDALARARDKDHSLKNATDEIVARLLAEPVPRGGYHRYRDRWLPLDERDRLSALDDAYDRLGNLDVLDLQLPFPSDPAQTIADRLRGKFPDGGAQLLRTSADKVRAVLSADYAAVRELLPSYARQPALRRAILAQVAELEPIRAKALKLIATYDKPQQAEVDALRRELEDGYREYVKLRDRDRIKWERTTPDQAYTLASRIDARETALAAVDRYLSTWSEPGLPEAAIEPADGASVSREHALPGRRQSGLEDVLWLLVRHRAGMAVDVLTRSSDLLRKNQALTPYEQWLAREIRDDAVDAMNARLALSIDEEERSFVTHLNTYRRVLGLRPFELEERCNVAARKHSQEMVDLDYFGHISPVARNRAPGDRVRLEGYNGGVGENCLAGNVDGAGAFEGWYHSPGHHRNLVSKGIHLGVGAAADHSMWTMVAGGSDLSWRALHSDRAPARHAALDELARQVALAHRDAPSRTTKAKSPHPQALERVRAAIPEVLPSVARIAFPAIAAKRDPNHAAAPYLLAFLTDAPAEIEWRPLQVAAVAASIDYLRYGGSAHGRRRALELVERYVGETAGYDVNASESARGRSVEKIRKRWEDDAQWNFRSADSTRGATVSIPGRSGDGPSLKSPLKVLTRRQRSSMAKRSGGGSKTEQAVERGLAFLARTQSADGAWRARSWPTLSPRFGKGAKRGNAEWELAMTGLALTAFASAGYTPEQGDYAEVVERGTDYLLQHIIDYGRFETTQGHYMYGHAMATQALCEMFAYTADPHIGAGAQLAVDYLMFAQHEATGGWRYEPNQPGDTSVTGWVMLALNSAHKAKLDVGGFRAAIRFFDSVTGPGYYLVGYTRPGEFGVNPRGMRLTSIGMVGRLFTGSTLRDNRVFLHAHRLIKRLPNAKKPDYYGWYYASLGMFQAGGKFWKTWNEALKPALLTLQDTDTGSPYVGAWRPDNEYGKQGGAIYSTSLGVLMLTNYYRYDRQLKTRVFPFTGDMRVAAVPYLDALKAAKEPHSRSLAGAKMVDELGTSCAPVLIELIKDPKTARAVRHYAVTLLAQVCEPQHEAGLHELLAHRDNVVAEHAMRALGHVCSSQSVPLLCNHLDHASATVRRFAADTLGRLGDAAASEPLAARLEREKNPGCQNAIRAAVRRLSHRRAMHGLVEQALGRSMNGAVAVFEGLELLDRDGLGEKLAATARSQPKLGKRIVAAIKEHREAATVPLLLLMLESDAIEVRTDALKLLRAITARQFKFDPGADKNGRLEGLGRWQAWWREHIDEFVARRRR